MAFKYIKYLFFSIFIISLTSCVSEDLEIKEDIEKVNGETNFNEGYSLSFTVSLDRMGGAIPTRSDADDKLNEYENYVDLEKFRVLFFDKDENFLFESKSRWVRQLTNEKDAEGATWFVSVPLFTYGNEEKWEWEGIRKSLTEGNFKIALLVNRPRIIFFGEYADKQVSVTQFDNGGPWWTPDNSVCGGKEGKIKCLFDLLHSQYDPIYDSKGRTGNWSKNAYDFMTDLTEENTLSYCSLDYWATDDKSSKVVNDARDFLTPAFDGSHYNHPIPMYGLQSFKAIEDWEKGTTYNLERGSDKAISLLRSVVRLELLIPKSKMTYAPYFVAIAYSNVYSRNEPVNVWTPTDELWAEAEEKEEESDYCKEMDRLMSYGPLALKTDPNPSTYDDYRNRYSWFYGSWIDKGWKKLTVVNPNNVKYPQLMNSCIQRNAIVGASVCKVEDGTYHRYVVYTGERNISEASKLAELGNAGSGIPTVMYWLFNEGNSSNSGTKLYGVPITDYSEANNPARNIPTQTYTKNSTKNHPYINETYMQAVMGLTGSNNKKYLPWPLVRNHVYKIYLGTGPTTKAGDMPETLGELGVECKDFHSETIRHRPVKSQDLKKYEKIQTK